MNDDVAGTFAAARAQRRAAFVPYVMAGDPDVATTLAIVQALTRAGADLIELGIPYGDPLADGPTIAAAGQRALAAKTGIAETFALIRAARAAGSAPVVLFTYFNLLYQYGIERFAADAAAAGVSGVIVPDITLEETGDLRAALRSRGLAMPLLIAPSTPAERAAKIVAASSGFVYIVSRLGVTGAGTTPDFAPLRAQLERLRALTQLPLAIGFGVSRPEHVRAVTPFADGVIVGSALIDAYAGTRGEEAAARVERFARSLAEETRR